MAVRATANVPCHGSLPPTLLADFLAVARYIRVGIVVPMMIMVGARVITKEIFRAIFLNILSLFLYLQE